MHGTISGQNILCTLPSGTAITALKPIILHTGATLNPSSETADNFTTPVTYTVTAEDGSTGNYAVSVSVSQSGPSVYVVGGQTFFGTGHVRVWKDGVGTSVTNGTYHSGGSSVFVKNNTLYLTGYQNAGRGLATYWQIENGTELPTPGLNETSNDALANSVYVSDNNDVYVAGNENHGGSIGWIAKVWKNGVATHLTTATGGANSVFVSGSDVYVAGWETTASGYAVKVWKNGVATVLTPEDGNAYGKAVFVYNGVVYVAGQQWDAQTQSWIITVWENGTPHVINNAGSAEVSGMFVSNGDVYLVGTEIRNNVYNAKIWKNGTGTFLSESGGSDTRSVYVYNNDVYVAGWEYDGQGLQVATLWKNGVGTALATEAYASGVVVK